MKRIIDISNYEEWFIDYLDGNLTASEEQQIKAFIDSHPRLSEELMGMNEIVLVASSVQLYSSEKSAMKHEEEDEDAIIAFLESGEKDPQALSSESSYLLSVYRKTKVIPDLNIKYPDPASLKKRAGIIIPMWTKVSAAAASLMLAFLFISQDGNSPGYSPRTGALADWERAEMLKEGPDVYSPQKEGLPILTMVQEKDVAPSKRNARPSLSPSPLNDNKASIPAVEKSPSGQAEMESLLLTEEVNEAPVDQQKENPVLADVNPKEHAVAHLVPVSKSMQGKSSYSSTLDLLKKATENSDILAIQDLDSDAPYIEGFLKVGNFELSIKRRRK